MKIVRLAGACLVLAVPTLASAAPSSTITSIGPAKLSAKSWTLQFDNAIETTRSPFISIPVTTTCVMERSAPTSFIWRADEEPFLIRGGGRLAIEEVLCENASSGTDGWPDIATIQLKSNQRVFIQISPSLKVDGEDCSGVCRVVRGNRKLRIPLTAKYGAQSFKLGRLEITVRNYKPERVRRVWQGTDEFVNFCINSSAKLISSGGRLYCNYYDSATARATARLTK